MLIRLHLVSIFIALGLGFAYKFKILIMCFPILVLGVFRSIIWWIFVVRRCLWLTRLYAISNFYCFGFKIVYKFKFFDHVLSNVSCGCFYIYQTSILVWIYNNVVTFFFFFVSKIYSHGIFFLFFIRLPIFFLYFSIV